MSWESRGRKKAIPAPPRGAQSSLTTPDSKLPTRSHAKPKLADPVKRSHSTGGGLSFGAPQPVEPVKEKPKREPRQKQRNDPRLVAAARELRDRWLEQVNAEPIVLVTGKYDVSRMLSMSVVEQAMVEPIEQREMKVLTAA